jgi:hypothetical protein
VTIVTGLRWRKGWDDLVPLAVWTAPLLVEAFLPGARGSSAVVLVVAAVAVGLGLKHLLPAPYEDLTVLPPALALLIELSTVTVSLESLLLSAVAGVGLLLWLGAEPTSGVSLRRLLEPAVVPALAVGLALAVMLFLPVGTGAQVGLAALALVVVLGLVAWLYLRSVDETALPQPTS